MDGSPSSATPVTHPIHVAVMRTGKLLLATQPVMPIAGIAALSANGVNAHQFDLTQKLALPDTPGDTYLGQRFSTFVRVTNKEPFRRPIKEVSLRIEFVTPRKTQQLNDSRPGRRGDETNNARELKFNEGQDSLVNVLLTDMGRHTLRVIVQYRSPDSGQMCTCLKQYPLSVSLPINVNLRTLPVSDGQTTVVEANLRNMTTQQILLESVKLSEDERFYTSEDIAAGGSAAISHAKRGHSSVIESIISSGAHQRCAVLSPGCSAQYAFKLRLRESADKHAARTAALLEGVGRVSMAWRTSQGEAARLQTGMLRLAPADGDAEVIIDVVDFPGEMALGEVRAAKFIIQNFTRKPARDLSLRIAYAGACEGGLRAAGKSEIRLDHLPSGGSHIFELQLVAAKSGLQDLAHFSVHEGTKTHNISMPFKVIVQ